MAGTAPDAAEIVAQQLTATNALVGALNQRINELQARIDSLEMDRAENERRWSGLRHWCGIAQRKLQKKKRTRPAPAPAVTVTNETLAKIFSHMSQHCGKSFQVLHPDGSRTKSAEMLAALLKRGYTEQQVLGVCGNRWLHWKDDPKMQAYYRPLTIFAPSKFAEYLSELGEIAQ